MTRSHVAISCAGVALLVLIGLLLWSQVDDADDERVSGTDSETREAPLLEGRGRPLAPLEVRASDGAATSERPLEPPFEYTVRDLATGNPIPGVEFELRPHGAPVESARSDIAGQLTVPSDPKLKLIVVDPRWKSTWRGLHALRTKADLWVYRVLRVRGTVRSTAAESDRLDTSSVCLTVSMVGTPSGEWGKIGNDPWNARWAQSHGLWKLDRGQVVAEDGTYEITVPYVRGVVVRADATGWMSAWAHVPPRDDEPVEVPEILLRRAIRVTGQVTDEDGMPIANARVRAFVTQRRTAYLPDLDVSQLQLVGDAVTGITGASGEEGNVVSFEISVDLEEDGRFEFEHPTHGELLLIAEARAYATARRSLGLLRSDPAHQQIGLAKSEAPTLRFVRAGTALAKWKFIVSDLMGDPRGMEPQPASAYRLSKDGRAPGEAMEAGRDYHVILTSPDGEEYVQFHLEDWNGVREIDITQHVR